METKLKKIKDTLYDLSELFKVFGDSTRIKILYDLFSGEKNVTEICQDLEMNQSAVSHQLKILRTTKLVQGRREGKSIVYALADDHVKTIIAMGIEHIGRRNKEGIKMKKKYDCEIDCANCAAEVQDAISKINGVQSAKVNFMMQKFTLEAEDERFDEILKEAIRIGKTIEPDFKVMGV